MRHYDYLTCLPLCLCLCLFLCLGLLILPLEAVFPSTVASCLLWRDLFVNALRNVCICGQALYKQIVWLIEEHLGVDLCREFSCCFLGGWWLCPAITPGAPHLLQGLCYRVCGRSQFFFPLSDLLNWVAEKQVSWGQRLWRRSLCWLFPDTWSYTTLEAVITKIWPRNSKPGDT